MSVNSKMTAIADAIRNLLDISGTMGLDAMASNISSITKHGAVTGTILTKSDQYIIPAGYHNGNGSVGIADDEQAKIIPENIKSGVTILGVSGTASGDIYAIISVTYPVGSICTCTDGTTTLIAKDTSGMALFNVKAGTYTVECNTSDNSKSNSTSVTVTESDAGKCISVTLNYRQYFVKNGVILVEFTKINVGSISTVGDTALIETNGNVTCVAYINENISDYQNLILDVTSSEEKISRSWKGTQVPALGLTQNTPILSGDNVTPTYEGGLVYLNSGTGNIIEGSYIVPVDNLNDYFNVCISVAGSKSNFSDTVGRLYIKNFYLE